MPAELHCAVPPIPYEDESLNEIWSGHMLEHLEPEKATEFLAECYRCLVPGGKLGILVPDTREIMRRYLEQTDDQVQYPLGTWRRVADLDEVCALFLYSTVQDSRHAWSYDADTLRRAMERAGFGEFMEIDRHQDYRIPVGAFYQVGFDAYKPKEVRL